jgi:hypothetical protein
VLTGIRTATRRASTVGTKTGRTLRIRTSNTGSARCRARATRLRRHSEEVASGAVVSVAGFPVTGVASKSSGPRTAAIKGHHRAGTGARGRAHQEAQMMCGTERVGAREEGAPSAIGHSKKVARPGKKKREVPRHRGSGALGSSSSPRGIGPAGGALESRAHRKSTFLALSVARRIEKAQRG